MRMGCTMKKAILVAGIVCLILVLFICGCTEQKENGTGGSSTTGKTVTMTAEEWQNDADIDINQETEPYYAKILSKSLDEGDTLIIQDTISEISYNSSTDITTITFTTSGDPYKREFEGDLTVSFQAGDEVKITVTIKHVEFTYESVIGTMDFDMEVFEEIWVSEEYYKTKSDAGELGYKSLPQSCIAKV